MTLSAGSYPEKLTQPEEQRTTLAAPVEAGLLAPESEVPRTTPMAEEDDFSKTGEGAALDFLDTTLAKPKRDEPAPGERKKINPDGSEEVLIADDLADLIDLDDEEAGATENAAAQLRAHERSESSDLDEHEEKPAPGLKRTVPPPIPRG